jgi:benzodiazapine receptor
VSTSSVFMLLGFVVVCFSSTFATVRFRPDDWYEGLVKPSWQPPNWLFAPVWTFLYLTIAVSGWLVWRELGFADAAWPFVIYAVQLVLNGVWTPVFFGLRRTGLALLDINLVWLSIVATIIAFYPISSLAGLLLLPYLAWVSFAAVLNFAIWRLNRRAA